MRPAAETKLFSDFMAWPLPSAPVATTLLPIAASRGRQCSTASVAPPAMMVSSPVRARGTPPDTGASTMAMPCAASIAPSCAVPCGSQEPMSMTTLPRGRRAARPPSPVSTCCTTFPSGSIRITASSPGPRAPRLGNACPPVSVATACATSGRTSTSCSAKPAAASRAAIGRPMLPRPTKPTVLPEPSGRVKDTALIGIPSRSALRC